MRRVPLCLLIAAGLAGCPQPVSRPDATLPDATTSDRPNTDSRTDSTAPTDTGTMTDSGMMMMPDGMMMPMDTGVSTDATMMMPDAASGPSAQIRAVQMAAAGAVDLPIDGVLVTYVVPATAGATATNDPAGFSVQADATGPALFIAVDPATLMPSPAVGDRVSFRVTMTRSLNGGASRWASAVSGYMRASGSNPVDGLTQDLSNSADIVSALGSYEYELVRLTGSITDNGSNAGAAFRSFAITTMGLPSGDANLRVRLPQTLAEMLGVRTGCRVTLGPTPLWRFTAQAQPSAWRAGDIMLSGCPAVMDSGVDSGADAATDARTDTGVVTDSGVAMDAGSDARADASDAAADSPSGDACVPRIVVNEVQSRGAGDASTEFVEIFNAGTCAVNLNGWTVRYAAASSTTNGSALWTGTASQVLMPGQYGIVRSSPVAAPPAGVLDLVASPATSLGLNDAAGGIGLYNGSTRIDSVTWQQMGGSTMVGASHLFREGTPATTPVSTSTIVAIARIPNASDTDNNSVDFATRTTATPGASNM